MQIYLMVYYLLYGILGLLSFLPLTILYKLSNLLAFIMYYIFRYRRKVVRENLLKSFPDKTINEIILIEKKFYRFLCRLIVETIKLISIPKNELKQRCIYTQNFQNIFNKYAHEKKNVIVLMGHLGNWEWAGAAFNLHFSNQLYALYHPLSSPSFDKLVKKLRTRFGTQLISMRTAYKHILSIKTKPAVFTFIADQCPSPQNAFSMTFLNQNTLVYYGPELIAQKLKFPVVFVSVKQIKAGYYEVDGREYLVEVADYSEYPVMKHFMQHLEEKIKEQPEIWLWSHKRWKHKATI
ncbi:MAG: lysophospholipid acyltransferase family protein [Bacteroidia bacterium]|nr:lysophospholipid acyltransferase family protein [Bacteroidia bacterium]